MRLPEDVPRRARGHRRGVWLLVVLALLVVLLVVVQAFAGFYTNFLWFHWTALGVVWRGVMEAKISLVAVFVALAFALLSTSFWLVDKIAPRAMFMAPDAELVRRYQAVVGPHARLIRNVVALLVALALGSGTSSQWQHWLLFEHAVPFGRVDPLFHRDASFFVFRLPFLSFVVDWVLVALLVALVLSAVGHFLNGAIRLQGSPRIEPRALAHLSLLLGLMALVRAWAYYYVDRFALDLSSNGVVNGASYTDVHVRLPAITLLSVVSLVAFVLLVVNVYQRNWVLPIVAVGLWAFLAIAVGVVYPALFQALRVTPSQSALEKPYIESNISSTQYAMGIASVTQRAFPANQDLTPTVLKSYQQTLDDIVLWDPQFVAPTFAKYQEVHSYYQLSPLAVDRYVVDGVVKPVVVGVRELNISSLPAQYWVNTHLQYTHGYGVVVAKASAATARNGEPEFIAGNLPPTSTTRALALDAPGIYYAPGQHEYVVTDTRQSEIDYQENSGNQSTNDPKAGGVPVSSLLTRLAYAIHLRDFNLLVSNDITGRSHIIPITDVRTAMQKALPFLDVDANPYPVIAGGQVYWMADAYATTRYYPYAETADVSALPQGSGLSGSYDFVRDAVKIVMNAHTGRMRFYTVDARSDPLIESYSRAFPGLFKPLSEMNATLRAHLRYPQDLLMVQAAMYGRYHVAPSQALQFYSGSAAWDLSETSTSADGEPRQPLAQNPNGTTASYRPVYELLQLPGEHGVTFNAVEPLVPYSQSGNPLQTLKAVLVADSSYSSGDYGKLESFYTPAGSAVPGPSYANSEINSNTTVSKQITLLGQGGSVVQLGTVQILPIDGSLLYVRPLYLSSSQTDLPLLADVVIQYGQQVVIAPTLKSALADVFGSTPRPSSGIGSLGSSGPPPATGTSSSSTASVSRQVRSLVARASAAYDAAESALSHDQLGAYQADVTLAGKDVESAERLLAASTEQASKSATRTNRGAATTSAVKLPSDGASGSGTGERGRSTASDRRSRTFVESSGNGSA